MRLLPRFLLALATALIAAPAQAATLFDPAVDWKTIVTPHFRVNYPAGYDALARLAAGYAEEAHTHVSPWLDSVPGNRTELTLVDHEDTVNGYAVPLPNNQIFIYLSSPPGDELMSRYDSWLRDLILHEYTHVLHMEKTAGLAGLVNTVFGRSYFPNMIQPIFLIEGLAVHTETKWSHGGRGRDANYRMYLRMAALDGKLASMDQACGYTTIDHPGGEIPYVYGMAFYRHLARHYGEDAPARLAKLHASNPYVGVWGIDDELQAITGRMSAQLWREMEDELRADARRQRDEVLARGPITAVARLTEGGQLHRHPRFFPNGDLGWAEWTGHGWSTLYAEKLGDPASRRRVMSKSPYGTWDVSRDGRYLYHNRTWDENRFTSYGDAFRYDMEKKKLDRLSTRARLDSPAVSPDGRWVVAVKNGQGQSNLVKMRADGSGARPLTTFTDRSQLSSPAWHPKASVIALSAWKDGGRDLYGLDPETGRMQALWHDRAVDLDPAWSPDGRYLLFASDREGIYNLYAYEPAKRRLFRVTNVLGGVVEPAVSPDGKTIACSTYGTSGWDIGTLPFDPARWTPVPLPVGEAGLAQPLPAVDPAAFPGIDYTPWPSLVPKTWAPFGFQDERGPVVGFQTFGQDTLMRHYAFGAFGLGLGSARPFYQVGYSNEVLYPSLYAYAQEASLVSAPVYQGVPLWVVQRGQYQGVSATFPGLPSIFLQNVVPTGDLVSVAFQARNIQDLNTADVARYNLPAALKPSTGQTNSVALTYKYGDPYRFAYSVSPEGGNLVTLGYERAMPELGSQYSYDRVWADLRRYSALPWLHHALGVRLSGGTNLGREAGNFYLGGSESATLLSNVDLRTASDVGTRSMPLRGYPFATQAGPNAFAAVAEWRFPLLSVQRGYGLFPLFVRNLHGAAFVEAGQAWYGPFDWRRSLADVGFELRAQTQVQQAPTEVRVGLGQGLVATGGGWQLPNVFAEVGTYF